ncbi:uncharacterized protein Tco025E_04723 [Trypanosoma conorhini]|uniref:Uncharacterized protein n=1 Tax=Trypanosoma conorhini TaxID=83891 RepID=A0A3S5ITG3_9TRYP|nr:uncharacterized protein Tco025E_04723 [Trypanosoma conorhini]RNF17780.1 hypothetical protein Tco025E_04723 [Trypanosoma conorhini]
MARLDSYALGLLFAASALLFATAHASDELLTPMCSEVIGFAGEYNDRILVGVPVSPAAKEAIVLIVRAFPLNLGELSQRWIQLNATYRLREGAVVSLQSNNDGIVVIPNVEAGTNIEVRVKRVRRDGPVPFRFWSFHANRPSCQIDVSPTNSFLAPIPLRLSEVAAPVGVYFKSVAPPGSKGFIVEATFGFFMLSAAKYVVMTSPTNTYGVTRSSGEVVPWSEGVVYLMLTPPTTTETSQMLQVRIVWVDDLIAAGGKSGGVASTQPPGKKAGEGATPLPSPETPSTGAGKDNSPSRSDAGNKKGWSVSTLIFVLLFSLAVYMFVMSVVNYRLKGATEFPEMIPFVGVFRSCGEYVSLAKDAVLQSGGGQRGGYSDLAREGVSTDHI